MDMSFGLCQQGGHHNHHHHHHHHVKAEYASHVGLLNPNVDDLGSVAASAEMAAAVGGPLPALMHMGYGSHRHVLNTQDPSQASMCSYLPHRSAW